MCILEKKSYPSRNSSRISRVQLVPLGNRSVEPEWRISRKEKGDRVRRRRVLLLSRASLIVVKIDLKYYKIWSQPQTPTVQKPTPKSYRDTGSEATHRPPPQKTRPPSGHQQDRGLLARERRHLWGARGVSRIQGCWREPRRRGGR